MLENINDYLALIIIVLVVVVTILVALYFINLSVIEKNVRKEILYYHYDENNIAKK